MSLYEQAGVYSLEQESGYVTESTESDIDSSDVDVERSECDIEELFIGLPSSDFDLKGSFSALDNHLLELKNDIQKNTSVGVDAKEDLSVGSQDKNKVLASAQGLTFFDDVVEYEENQNHSDSGFDDSTDPDCSFSNLERWNLVF